MSTQQPTLTTPSSLFQNKLSIQKSVGPETRYFESLLRHDHNFSATMMNAMEDVLMERMQRQTLVDLVQLPYLRAAPTGQDVVRILNRIQSSTMEGLRLPILNVSQFEALQECLATHPNVRMVSVQELSSNMAYAYFCRAMEVHQIRSVELGRSDRMVAKDVSIVGCNALANLLEQSCAMQQLCLTSLRLSRPHLVAHGISLNRTLRDIKLRNVQIGDFSIFLRALENLPLESLTLEDMEIDTEGSDDATTSSTQHESSCSSYLEEPDSPWLYLPQTIRKIILIECSLCTPEVQAICDGLVNLQHLSDLTLSICDLLPSAAYPLRTLIGNNQSLRHINLEQNLMGAAGVANILPRESEIASNALSVNLQSNNIRDISLLFDAGRLFHALDLSDNPLGPSIPDMVVRPQPSCQLKNVHLDSCCLTDDEIVALCKIVPESVAELCLANNVVHQAGAEALRKLLGTNRNISSLDVSSCHIDDATIAQLLPELDDVNRPGGLRELYLAFNKIQNDGMISIAKYLRQRQCHLHTLNLQFNDFDDTGLQQIESVLSERNTSLCHFYFWSSNLRMAPAAETKNSDTLEQRIDHWLALNKAGRRALPLMSDGAKPRAYWAPILAHADQVYGVSGVFYFLQNRPDLLWDRDAQ